MSTQIKQFAQYINSCCQPTRTCDWRSGKPHEWHHQSGIVMCKLVTLKHNHKWHNGALRASWVGVHIVLRHLNYQDRNSSPNTP